MTTFFRGSLILGREVARGSHVQGGDRRPSRADLTPVDVAAVEAWQRVQDIARAEYARRMRYLDERAAKDARNEEAAK